MSASFHAFSPRATLAPVQFLPIVERELRVASRQPRTWWRRGLTFLGAGAVFLFVWMVTNRGTTASALGRTVFDSFTVFGFIYALLAGPMATADALSRERREGTLGLLFLTDLHSYDVVLGKVFASSFDVFLGLMATLPMLALPVLLGGVTLAHFGQVVLMLASAMLLSVATGAFASSLCSSGRVALGLTLLMLLALTLGLPLIGEEILRIQTSSKLAPYVYMICPLWAVSLCMRAGTMTSLPPGYWLSMAGMQGLAWVLLLFACFRTAKHWREAPESRWRQWLRGTRERLQKGNAAATARWRQQWLEINPLAWLELRDRLQGRVLAILIAACALFWGIQHLRFPKVWPSGDAIFFWPMWSHYLFCVWLAIQAPRRLADDKQSGALELLLSTGLGTEHFLRGMMLGLWRRFGRALAALVLLDAFIVYAHCSQSGFRKSLTVLCFWATVVFVLQGWTLARVGLYQGLVKGNSLKATFNLVFTLGVLPWTLFAAWMISLEYFRRYIPSLSSINEIFVMNSWAGAHLLVFGLFSIHASRQLHCHFRALAASPAAPWFKRWMRSAAIPGRSKLLRECSVKTVS